MNECARLQLSTFSTALFVTERRKEEKEGRLTSLLQGNYLEHSGHVYEVEVCVAVKKNRGEAMS